MTIDQLARMSQNEFTAIRSEVKEGFEKAKEDTDLLRRDMEAGFQSLAEILKLMREDVKDIKGGVITINEDYSELRARVGRLEKKVGLSR